MEKVTLEKEVTLSSVNKMTSKDRFTFDATPTLNALRAIAKKRDAKLNMKVLKIFEDQLKNPPKEQPIVVAAPAASFKSSLPIRVTPKARDLIANLKKDGVTAIRLPKVFRENSKITIIKNNKETSIGVMRAEVESDLTKMCISDVGLFIDVCSDNPEMLDFILKTPGLPGVLRSSKLNDQGGLMHQLKMSYAKKGGQ